MQGKNRNKESVTEILKPYFKLGYSLRKACDAAGIPPSTFQTWYAQDDDLRAKITAWQSEVNSAARQNWALKIVNDKDYQASKDWLERREKEDFSLRQEVTGSDGSPIVIIDAGKNPYNGEAKKFLPDK